MKMRPHPGAHPLLAPSKKENYHVETVSRTMNPEINTTPLPAELLQRTFVERDSQAVQGTSSL